MAKRFDPPLPLAPLRDAETLQACQGPVYRTALALLMAFWSSGCRELPRDASSLAIIARMLPQHITPVLPAILATLDELCPRLATAYVTAKAKHAAASGRMSNAIAAAAAMRRKPVQPSDRTFSQPLAAQPIARVASPHVDTAADMPALRALAARQRADTPGLLVQRRGNLA